MLYLVGTCFRRHPFFKKKRVELMAAGLVINSLTQENVPPVKNETRVLFLIWETIFKPIALYH